jgi:hypothetical protein
MTTDQEFREECERSGDVFSIRDRPVTCLRQCPCPKWLPMASAPFDTRVLVRDRGGVTIAQRTALFGENGTWFDDYASPVTPISWMPLPTPQQKPHDRLSAIVGFLLWR